MEIVPGSWKAFSLPLLLIPPLACCSALPEHKSELGQGRGIYFLDEGIMSQHKLLNPDTCRTPLLGGGGKATAVSSFRDTAARSSFPRDMKTCSIQEAFVGCCGSLANVCRDTRGFVWIGFLSRKKKVIVIRVERDSFYGNCQGFFSFASYITIIVLPV